MTFTKEGMKVATIYERDVKTKRPEFRGNPKET